MTIISAPIAGVGVGLVHAQVHEEAEALVERVGADRLDQRRSDRFMLVCCANSVSSNAVDRLLLVVGQAIEVVGARTEAARVHRQHICELQTIDTVHVAARVVGQIDVVDLQLVVAREFTGTASTLHLAAAQEVGQVADDAVPARRTRTASRPGLF